MTTIIYMKGSFDPGSGEDFWFIESAQELFQELGFGDAMAGRYLSVVDPAEFLGSLTSVEEGGCVGVVERSLEHFLFLLGVCGLSHLGGFH